MGLLDFLTKDPEQQAALTQGLLSGAFGAMAGRGSKLQAWGQGGLAGLQGYSGAREDQAQAKLRESQMKRQSLQDQLLQGQIGDMQRTQRLADLPQQFMVPGMKPETMDNRDVGAPGEQQIPARQFDLPGYSQALMGLDPMRGLQLQSMLQKQEPAPIKVGKDEVLLDPTTRKPLFFNVQPEKDPEQIRMLKAIYGDGTPAFQAALQRLGTKATTHAPAASVNVGLTQEKEESKAVGKLFGEQYGEIQRAGVAAAGKLNKLDRMSSFIQGVNTGKLAPAGKEAASYLQSVGIKIDPNLGNKEAIEALSNEMALEMRNPAGGAGMPGAMSDQDRQFLQNIVPSLSKTPEGNRLMIETARRIAKRDQEVSRLARDYRKKRGTIDEGFYDELEQFASKTPLFGGLAAPAAPDGSFSDAEKERRYQEWKARQGK